MINPSMPAEKLRGSLWLYRSSQRIMRCGTSLICASMRSEASSLTSADRCCVARHLDVTSHPHRAPGLWAHRSESLGLKAWVEMVLTLSKITRRGFLSRLDQALSWQIRGWSREMRAVRLTVGLKKDVGYAAEDTG